MSRAAVSFFSLTLVAALTPVSQAIAQSAAVAVNQTTPGAGDVLRDLPSTQPAMPALPEAALSSDNSNADKAPAISFVLRELKVPGATALTPQQIARLAEPYVDKPMNEQQLSALAAALRKRYEEKGYTLVAIGFPTQDVSKGELTINVIEPKLGQVQMPLGADAPVSEARIKGLMSFFNVQSGGLLSTQSLERVMFALNDTPGVQAKAALSPAGDEGVYNLSIQVQPRRSWDASIGLDNQGINDAGRWRTTGLARLNNPLGIGDNLDLQGLLSDEGGVKVGRVAYELPVGYTPARLSVAYAKVDYSLGGDLAAYGANGTARVAETNLTYPLIRSRTRTLMVRIGAESKNLTDKLDSFDIRGDKRILAGLAGLTYESRDAWMGGGFNNASAQFHWGHLRFKDDADREFDAARGDDYDTAGRFGKVELQYSRLQGITHDVSLYANVSQQLASRNLDAAEKMTLGGPKGVRAYSSAEGASDEAMMLNSELRYWINQNWTVFALYDWAKGRRTRDVSPADTADNDIQLRAAGLGVVASYPNWATVKATVAWRGSRLPEADTSKDKPRLFVQAQHSF